MVAAFSFCSSDICDVGDQRHPAKVGKRRKRRTHGRLRLRRNKHRGKKGRRARFLWPLNTRVSVSRGTVFGTRRLIARLFGVDAFSPVRWDRDEGQ